jgi:Ca-activated chloride channel homolog
MSGANMRRSVASGSTIVISIAAIGCILLFLGLAKAQSSPDGSASRAVESSNTTIRVHSDLVLIPVTVTDGHGRIITGLTKEHFTLYEDKVEQVIRHFASEDNPVSIGLVFDASDSMSPRLQKAREAVYALLNSTNPEDEFFLVRFSDRADLVTGMTRDREEIRRRVASLRLGGSTALLDAVMLARKELRRARYDRKAIVIISDGADNSSRCSVSQLKEAVREADVLIYAIGITEASVPSFPNQGLNGSYLINEIATETGGRLFEVSKVKQLPDIAGKISAWLRSQYVLGYAPNNPEKDGRYRRVHVKLTRPDGFPRLHALWRLGYYTPRD